MFPAAKTEKPRKYHIPDAPAVSAEAALTEAKWQKITWRRGTKGPLTCHFAARRVRVADGRRTAHLRADGAEVPDRPINGQ